jgi:membrane protease YdiL (CAAX protease family)
VRRGADLFDIQMSDTSFRLAESAQYNILRGPNGLRAGWRLLIFFAILAPLGYCASKAVDTLTEKLNTTPMGSPLGGTVMMGIFLVALLLASGIMARVEGRSIADYGLPWRRAFCSQFWLGAVFGFASLTVLLLVIHLAGGFSFGSLALHGADIWKYGFFWSVPLFLSALLEDFFYRGYLLFTLTTGIGFWPAAFATSLWMGGMHYLNPGGHGLGPVAAFLYCIATCVVIRKTGDLWAALGIHAAFGWGEIFFYGVVSSGFPGQGHLFNSSFHGSTRLTGGSFGPEASLPSLAMLVIWGILFSLWFRDAKYPNAAAIRDPRLKRGPVQTAERYRGIQDVS